MVTLQFFGSTPEKIIGEMVIQDPPWKNPKNGIFVYMYHVKNFDQSTILICFCYQVLNC